MSIRVVAASSQGILGNDGPVWSQRTAQFSVMWWDRLAIGAALGRVFQVATSGVTNRMIFARQGGGLFTNVAWSTTGGDFNAGTGLPDDGAWHCFHYIYNATSTGNVPTLYVDGQATTLTVVIAPVGTLTTIADGDFATYGNRQTLASPMVGSLAHFAMWPDRLLTVEDVDATLKRGPLACGVLPALYYPFDPTLPGGILAGRGTLTPPMLSLRANTIFPFVDADDPYRGTYVGGRRWRGRKSRVAFASSGITGSSSATFALSGSATGALGPVTLIPASTVSNTGWTPSSGTAHAALAADDSVTLDASAFASATFTLGVAP